MECTESPAFVQFAEVAIPDLALPKTLDYGVPEILDKKIAKGSAVTVSICGKLKKGYVVALKKSCSLTKVNSIETVQEDCISLDLLELAIWLSTYYLTPLPLVLKTLIPSSIRTGRPKEQFIVALAKTKDTIRQACVELREHSPLQVKVLETVLESKKKLFLSELLEKAMVSRSPVDSLQKKGFLTLEKIRLFRSPLEGEDYFPTLPKQLNAAQEEALKKIIDSLDLNEFSTYLLFGITGSGKTEVYLQAIERARALGKGTIMLVPEIALTVQTVERFKSRFKEGIAILHHRLSDGERYDEWEKIGKGQASIVIGPRSALFASVHNLGLLIVDEEHDNAYKQSEKMPCYHARDVAVFRGKMHNATVILGSATPSLESFYNTTLNKYKLLSLPSRVLKAQLPHITLVDMKKAYEKAGGFTLFSEKLLEKIKEKIELGEQSILFLNRRGYHTSLTCLCCGFVFKCSQCEVPYTFHYKEHSLSCHLCNEKNRPARYCTQCKKEEGLKYRGCGTELVERSLQALLPGIRTLRMDRDTTSHKGSHEAYFRDFRTGKSDVLIGTQMVAKGLHFPSVTLVALLNADSSLHIPDFRAAEQSFQLITQVAGRAGRAELPGEVIIQTLMPDHPVIQLAVSQDFEKFFEYEIASRKAFGVPPYTHFIKFLFEGLDEKRTLLLATNFRKELVLSLEKNLVIYPLVPAGHPKIKNLYRFQFLLKGGIRYEILEKIASLKNTFPLPRPVRLTIDVDPFSTFF